MTHLPETDSNDKTHYKIWAQNHKVPNYEHIKCSPWAVWIKKRLPTALLPFSPRKEVKKNQWKIFQRINKTKQKNTGTKRVGEWCLWGERRTQFWSTMTGSRIWDAPIWLTARQATAYFEKDNHNKFLEFVRPLQWAEGVKRRRLLTDFQTYSNCTSYLKEEKYKDTIISPSIEPLTGSWKATRLRKSWRGKSNWPPPTLTSHWRRRIRSLDPSLQRRAKLSPSPGKGRVVPLFAGTEKAVLLVFTGYADASPGRHRQLKSRE